MINTGLLLVALVCLANGTCAAQVLGAVSRGQRARIVTLRTEGVENPLGLETQALGFSWRYEATDQALRGFSQVAYRVAVAASPEELKRGMNRLWDSGKCPGSETLYIAYKGKPLESARRYYWQVVGYDAEGREYVSGVAAFEMGLLKNSDWGRAQWISHRKTAPDTIPSKVEQWTDYTVETGFRIKSTCANVIFRARYAGTLQYMAQIEPGTNGNIRIYKQSGENKLLNTFDARKPITLDTSYTLKVEAAGGIFQVYLDGMLMGTVEDNSLPSGTVGVGACGVDGAWGEAYFDNFRVYTKKGLLFEDDFEDASLNNFQDLLFLGGGQCQPVGGALHVYATQALIEVKRGLSAPLFRRSFGIRKSVKRARAYVSGIGYYEMTLNGKKVGDRLLEPGYSRYDKTVYYSVYDIKEQLAANNTIGFELGRGWYSMTTPTLWGEFRAKEWLAEPKLKALLKIEYADGSVEEIVTDERFKTALGPILFDSLKAGEIYDARKEIAGWALPAFDDRQWTPAISVSTPFEPSPVQDKLLLHAQVFPPIREVEKVPAVSVKSIGAGAYAVDFGRHMAGNVELKVSGKAGDKVMMQYAERAVEGGVPIIYPFAPAGTGCYQQDTYILKGQGEETYQAKFSYKGFRYLIVTGFPGVPTVTRFTAKVINSDMRGTGTFESSSELLNKISNASRASIQSNMHSIPTDCPTFEKLGWTCDDAGPMEAMMYYFDIENLYKKRLNDYADDIGSDGAISDVLPSTWGLKGSDPAWNGSLIAIAWKMYVYYGNRTALIEHYAEMKRYLDWLTRRANQPGQPAFIVSPNEDCGYGDWAPPDHKGGRGPEGISLGQTVYYYWYTTLMRDIAVVLGKSDDSKAFEAQALNIKNAINARYFDARENAYYYPDRKGGFRQSAQVLPLQFGLVPEGKDKLVADRLAADVRERSNHFWVGILGFEFIADVLTRYGYADLAYEGNLKTDFPSIGNMITEGATTLWESYSLATTRSLNHKMYSTISEWLFRSVAGLGVDENVPGFKRAIFAPQPCPDKISFAGASYASGYGLYTCRWQLKDRGFEYAVTVPPNACGLIRLPIPKRDTLVIREGSSVIWKDGRSVASVKGVVSVEKTPTTINIQIGSGNYMFQVE